ncbi:MAG: endolytic transglycosylase MltG [Alphaproteobacteria bacterium]
MLKFLGRLVGLVLILGLVAAGIFAWGWARYTAPGPLQTETRVVIARGSSVDQIAQTLSDAGVIEDPMIFKYADWLERTVIAPDAAAPLRAGEFAMPAGISAREARQQLIDGPLVQRRLTVPEGLTTEQILRLVNEAEGLTGDIETAFDEGELLPETYFYEFGDSRESLIQRMHDDMQAVLAEMWPQRADELPVESQDEAVILASIVQEEAGNVQEMPRVAAVFINRLKRGMRLQADATVEYGITLGTGPLGRGLLRSELETLTPYNTYMIDGLPPTPIANPGREAIEAVLRPAQTDELYFVADGSGGHAFARTLEEHERNVQRWRELERERAQATEQDGQGEDSGEEAPEGEGADDGAGN